MPCLDVEVPAPDGRSHGTLHVPDGDGPWPGVLMYPDAGGVRETFRQMGDHLAGLGYVVLIHGGRIAVAGDPSSPHLAADRITATVYVAGATDDGTFTAEQAGLLDNALTGAGVDHTVEFYPAAPRVRGPRQPDLRRRSGRAALGRAAAALPGSPPMTPGSDVKSALDGRPALLQDASRRALRYLAGLADRPVAPSAAAVSALRELDFPLPASGRDPAEVLALLDEIGSPATMASAGPRYFGFVTGGTLPVAQAAGWLASAWDQNTALSVMSPTATALDAVALRWVTELLGLPAAPAAASSPARPWPTSPAWPPPGTRRSAGTDGMPRARAWWEPRRSPWWWERRCMPPSARRWAWSGSAGAGRSRCRLTARAGSCPAICPR